jgi:hypothetical protein
VTGPDVVVKTAPGVCGDNLPLRFGSAYDATIVYDGAAEELTFQTKDGAGTLIDRVALRAGINNPSLVVNDPGADMDVRLEGDNDANLLFLDASVDRVGVGTATPGSKLTVNGTLAFTTLGAGADLNSQALTNANIDSGAIDGTPIGAAAAASVRGTTIEGTDSTDATSTTAAAMKTTGGLGVVKKSYFGDAQISIAALSERVTGGDGSSGGSQYDAFFGNKQSIPDNVATGFLRFTVSNNTGSLDVRVHYRAEQSNRTLTKSGSVLVTLARVQGRDTVSGVVTDVAPQSLTPGDTLGVHTMADPTFSMSAPSGAAGAQQTVDLQITSDVDATKTTNLWYRVTGIAATSGGAGAHPTLSQI